MSDSNLPLADFNSGLEPIEIGSEISVLATTISSPMLGESLVTSENYCAHDSHNRMDSIHLSSNASGSPETRVIANPADFSIHSFDHSESATELNTVHNLPRPHGIFETPDRSDALDDNINTQNLEDVNGSAEEASSENQPAPSESNPVHALKIGNEEVLTPRPSVKNLSPRGSPPALRQITLDSSIEPTESSSDTPFVSSLPACAPSPFDTHQAKHLASHSAQPEQHASSRLQAYHAPSFRPTVELTPQNSLDDHVSEPANSAEPTQSNGCQREANGLEAPNQSHAVHITETRIVSTGSGSGSGSSEEEDSWAMPPTPLMPDDSWDIDPPLRVISTSDTEPKPKRSGERGAPVAQTGCIRSKKSPSTGTTSVHRSHAVGGGRAPPRGLINNNGAKEGQRRVGRCKMYNCDKGVGFLIDDDLSEVPYDVKFHWTDIYSDKEFKSLAKGEVVEFTLNLTSNGYSASYVTGPGGRPVMGAENTIVQRSRQTSYKLFKAGALPVKTYRSKWDDVADPAGFLESPELPSRPVHSFEEALSPYTPRNNTGTTSASFKARMRAKTSKVKLPGMGEERFVTPALARATHPRVAIGAPKIGQAVLHPSQFATNSPWSHHVTSQNFLAYQKQPPMSFTPAMATNAALAQYEAFLSGGYTGQPIISPSPVLSAHPIQTAAPAPVDIHSILAERYLILQHQAAMVAFYQQHPVTTSGFGQPSMASHRQNSSLLPPIALAASHFLPAGHARAEVDSWTPGPALCANAQVFSPALEPPFSCLPAEARLAEPVTKPQVYQTPGRRTVSDPKPSVSVRKQSLVESQLEVLGAPRGYKRVTFAEDPVDSRRVVSYGDAAEDAERAARRVSNAQIAMERLRRAASPGHFSVLGSTHPNSLTQGMS